MFKILFKLIGCLIGIALALTAIAWSSDPTSGAVILLFGAILLIAGSLTKID